MKKQTFKIGNGIIPNFLVLFASAVLVLFAALFAVSPVTSQTNAEDAPAENGISLVTSKTIETSIRPNENGSLNIVKDTVVGSTSSAAGYELYISTNSEDENDIYLNGNTENTEATKKIAATTGTFETPAALDITNGATWGYAVAGLGSFDTSYNIYTPADTAKFAAMPTIENKQLIRETTTAIADDETEIYYGIKADSSLEPGLYKTEILYTAIPKTSGQCPGICYDGNGGTGTMGVQNATANDSIVLIAPKFTRSGYGFAGWNTAADGTGTNYGPNETITMPSGGLQLYATWVEPEQNVTLQSFDQTVSTYANMASGTIIALEDERDNQVYAVAKLVDGNWWMIESLRLDFSTDGTSIDATNTNNPTSAFVTAVNAEPASTTNWCTENTANCIDQIIYNNDNLVNENDGARDFYGVYYNWYSVTAGNGNYAQTTGDAAGDICPAGWHLPTGGSNGDFYNLNYIANNNSNVTNDSQALRAFSNNFTNSGYYYDTEIVARSGAGSYWSSTARTDTLAYHLGLNSTSVLPGLEDAGNGKQYGRAARCIANASRTFSLSYDAGDGTGAPAMQSGNGTHHNFIFTISNTSPIYTGHTFLGWTTDQNATVAEYQPGDNIIVTNAATTLYAVWSAN